MGGTSLEHAKCSVPYIGINTVDQSAFPACFTELRFYRNWKATVPHCPDKDRAVICHDCQPSYQLAMRKQGRCARPEVMFTVDRAGGVVGLTPEDRSRKSDSAKARHAARRAVAA